MWLECVVSTAQCWKGAAPKRRRGARILQLQTAAHIVWLLLFSQLFSNWQVKSAVRRAHWGAFLENLFPSRQQKGSGALNMELDEDCTLSDWEAMLELDEALALWVLQGPARGEWGWEWGWAASDLQDPEWDSEEIPAVSRPQLVSWKHHGEKRWKMKM